MLLHLQPGLGKTTLTHIIANESGVISQSVQGQSWKSQAI
ncbi:MAG: AAA family ATPase [Flavobacteriales bacterium]